MRKTTQLLFIMLVIEMSISFTFNGAQSSINIKHKTTQNLQIANPSSLHHTARNLFPIFHKEYSSPSYHSNSIYTSFSVPKTAVFQSNSVSKSDSNNTHPHSGLFLFDNLKSQKSLSNPFVINSQSKLFTTNAPQQIENRLPQQKIVIPTSQQQLISSHLQKQPQVASVTPKDLKIQNKSNSVNGSFNNIRGYGNSGVGDNNKLIGMQNNLIGNANDVFGISNIIKGDQNIVKNGKFNTIVGNQNIINEKSAQNLLYNSNANSVTGSNNYIQNGNENTINGSLNSIQSLPQIYFKQIEVQSNNSNALANSQTNNKHNNVHSKSSEELKYADKLQKYAQYNLIKSDDNNYRNNNQNFINGLNHITQSIINENTNEKPTQNKNAYYQSQITKNAVKNDVEGSQNTIMGSNNIVKGNQNKVIGLNNFSNGNGNVVVGEGNFAIQSQSSHSQNQNSIKTNISNDQLAFINKFSNGKIYF